MRPAVAFSALLALCACRRPSPPIGVGECPASLAFVDVTVLPMDAEREVAHATVLVKGDRIVTMGPAASVVVPRCAHRVEGAGRFLMPGLADMHTHANADYFPAFLAHGVTTIRNMNGRPKHLIWRDRIRRGLLLGPTLVTAGPILDGAPPELNGAVALRSASEASDEVRRQREAGYDFLKVLQVLPVEEYDAVFVTARSLGIPVAGHVPTPVGLAHVLEARQDSIEHVGGYLDEAQRDDSPFATSRPADPRSALRRGDFLDSSKLAALAGRTRDAGIYSCPTLLVFANEIPGRANAEVGRIAARYVSPAVRATWTSPDSPWTRGFDDADWHAAERSLRARMSIVRALRDAGAPLLAGTDDAAFDLPGWALHHELELLVGVGLTRFEALATATRNAASFLRLEGEVGRVSPGLRADLLLLDGNPLLDFKRLERPVGIVLRGRWMPADELRRLLEELAATTTKDVLSKLGSAAPGAVLLRTNVNSVAIGGAWVTRVASPVSTRIEAHESLLAPLGAADLNVVAVENERGASLRIDRRGDEESGFVEARLEGQALNARASSATGGEMSWQKSVSSGTLLVGPTAASYASLAAHGESLAVGASSTHRALLFAIDGRADEVELVFPPVDGQLRIERTAARSFSLEIDARVTHYRVNVDFDGRNLPRKVEIHRSGFIQRSSVAGGP